MAEAVENLNNEPQSNQPQPTKLANFNQYNKKIKSEVQNIIIRRSLKIALIGIIITLGVVYIILRTIDKFQLTVKINSNPEYSLILSEDSDFKDKHVILNAKGTHNLTHYTYTWLADQIKNNKLTNETNKYLYYSFYVKNEGNKTFDYSYEFFVTNETLGVEEAVRIMLIKNDEVTIFAKNKVGTDQPELISEWYPENTIPFLDDGVVVKDIRESSNPQDVDKYTIIIWLEGTDEQCVDNIVGGAMKFRMEFNAIIPEEER